MSGGGEGSRGSAKRLARDRLRRWVRGWPGWWRSLPTWKRWLPWILVFSYWGLLVAFVGGLKGDHVVYGGVILLLAHGGRLGRRLLGFALPFILTGILFDAQRYLGFLRARIRVAAPYLLERRLFGVSTPDGVLIPSEWLGLHLHPVLDFLSGLGYLTFVFVYILIALYFDFVLGERGKGTPSTPGERLRRMAPAIAWSFLLVNVLGYATWFLYPAAPPWYVETYGLGPADPTVLPHPARTVRFDRLFGTDFFGGMYGYGSNAFGALPSLHVSYPIISVYFAFRFGALRTFAVAFWLLMCFAAVYLNHHYVLDVLLGAVYGLVAAHLAWLAFRRFRTDGPRTGGRAPQPRGNSPRLDGG